MTASARKSSTWRAGAGVPSNAVGSDGDFYLNTTNGAVYQRSGNVYSVIANIMGPQGPGVGNTWRSGAGAPSNGTGIDGDLYYNSTSSDVYQRAAGTYSIIANIKGAAGAAGPSGPQGPTGAVWRTAAGAPSNGTGIDGDFYLNSSNGDVYLRASGIYSIVANIKGPAGTSNGTFAGGTITGLTTVQVADPVVEPFHIQQPPSSTAYQLLIHANAADNLNYEPRWFMAHPEGGLCLSSWKNPNWAVLHLYPYNEATTKPILRITDKLTAGGANDLVTVDKDGTLLLTPHASVHPFIVKDNAGNTLFDIDQTTATASGRVANKLRSSQDIVRTAMGMKVSTGANASNTASFASSGEIRFTAIGLRGGETYTNAYFINDSQTGVSLSLAKVGLYDSSWNLIKQTASMHVALTGVSPGLFTCAFTSTFTPTNDGVYYIGLLCVGTTPPGVMHLGSSGESGGNSNAVNGIYWARRQTGLADLPATATHSIGNTSYWWALT